MTLREIREAADVKAIMAALAKSQGNVSHAAQLLDVSRPTLHDLLKRYRLDWRRWRPSPETIATDAGTKGAPDETTDVVSESPAG